MTAQRTRWLGWLQLLRVPNLPTVPGDPLAGALLAAGPGAQGLPVRTATAVALAALLLYMAGLVLNDLHDLPADRIHRPERPLPRGVVTVRSARLAFALLAALGVSVAASAGWQTAVAGVCLLGLICLYDLRAKAGGLSACVAMGICRGASMMLGAGAGERPGAALLPALALAVYIGAVTWLSRREDETQRPGLSVLVPALALAGGAAAAWYARLPGRGGWRLAAALCAVLTVAHALRAGLGLFRRDVAPARARAAVGRFIGLLLPWQAGLVLLRGTHAAAVLGLALLLAWPMSRRLGRYVSAS